MNRTERVYRIQKILHEQSVVPRAQFLDDLEISLATFKRDLAYMRDRHNAPIEYDAEAGGYRFGTPLIGPTYELPGVWFNADEIHALLTMQQLLQELQPGLLTPHVQPLQDRLNQLLDRQDAAGKEVQKRIRVFRVNARHVRPKAFDPISTAVLGRRQIRIQYFYRGRNTTEMRTLSHGQSHGSS